MSYSHTGGGTLTLPSPTHVHHVDVGSAVRSLRRSLSRSPSKLSLFRTASSHSSDAGSTTSSQGAPESPCPTPAQPAPTAAPSIFSTTPHQTPFSTPLRSSVKLSLRSARPKTSSKPIPRARASPKSPLKRTFNTTSESSESAQFNATSEALVGKENIDFESFALAFSPQPRANLMKPSRHSMHLDLSGSSKANSSRFLDVKANPLSTISSPLKRTDAIMNTGEPNIGSPVAKRRSLHGISSLGGDFNVFDHAPAAQQAFDIHDEGNQEYQLASANPVTDTDIMPAPAQTPSAMPRRTNSLRKSTLQQRHVPNSSWGRHKGEQYLALNSPAAPRTRARVSVDQAFEPYTRESPFTVKGTGPLPNPSAHPIDRTAHQPHPLSRTLTTSSSSGSSAPDDSPTHFPAQNIDRPRPVPLFARTLPAGAQRPQDPIATPSFKDARPEQSAFASTGLISKMNRNPENEFAQAGGRRLDMPDTPCKKHVYPSNTYPPSSGSGRKHNRFLFGIPAAPALTRRPSGIFGGGGEARGGGLFQFRSQHGRKGSILGLEDSMDVQSNDGDLPPTPTKPVLARKFATASQIQSTPAATRTKSPACSASAIGLAISRPSVDLSCKSSLPTGCSASVEPSDYDNATPSRPTLHNPTPRKSSVVSFLRVNDHGVSRLSNTNLAKPASPLGGVQHQQSSPKTPHELPAQPAVAALDASHLSISSSQDAPDVQKRPFFQPPATPTAGRDGSFFVAAHRDSMTPVHREAPQTDDFALRARFIKVDSIGKGEFSHVFRCSSSAPSAPMSLPSSPPSFASPFPQPAAAIDERVFAVKKIAFQGPKDLSRKLAEVAALKAVRGKENVVQLENYWEEGHYLYIQTEYCEEGSLDLFLQKIGDTGRLDDFRIWKIMIEIAQGLQAIHNSGLIHLDLKPANVFVTGEGHLKIGDFGMSTQWPAPKGFEGEGDREYIGPEILRGKFDKPADIFALGMIVLETACNVFLPDNGETWVALRQGNMSVVPSLTILEDSAIPRDATGMPIGNDDSGFGSSVIRPGRSSFLGRPTPTYDASNLFGVAKRNDLEHPPEFMINAAHPGSLDRVVSHMLSPKRKNRPTAEQLLSSDSCLWVLGRRRAPAIVFEGNWGPADQADVLALSTDDLDTEMTDV